MVQCLIISGLLVWVLWVPPEQKNGGPCQVLYTGVFLSSIKLPDRDNIGVQMLGFKLENVQFCKMVQ